MPLTLPRLAGAVKLVLENHRARHLGLPGDCSLDPGGVDRAVLSKGKVIVRVGLAQSPDVDEVKLAARMNSVECAPLADCSDLSRFPISRSGRVSNAATAVKRVLQFGAPLSALQRGYNLVKVFLIDKPGQSIVWLEVYIVPEA